ncbi:flippase [Fibrisoma montanum]|uniref:flippase n=1 Tax=Fibrisoma montanum TaxID=2305895 RepID=UPI0013143A3A|nr:flippase [Fibrisoma montanum]
MKNFIALGLVQATNFIIPVITFPYLVRVIGPEKFGVISYGLTILMYFITFADYGFNLSATRLVALHHENRKELSRLFSSVMTTKFLLLLLSVLLMASLCGFVTRFREESFTYLLGMLYVLGNVLMPVWFFQGMEQMKYITYMNLVAKIALLILLFAVVREPQDYVYVLALYGIANVISGIYSIRVALLRYQLQFRFPTLQSVWEQLQDGWHIFSSSLSVVLTNNVNVLVLGFFVSNIAIGYYSIAEKIILVLWTVMGLFSQAIYPSVCRLAQTSHQQFRRFIWKVCFPFIGAISVVSVLLYVLAEPIVQVITGNIQAETVRILRIVSVVPLIVCLNIPAYQTLLAYNYKKYYAAIFNGSAVLNLIVCPLLVYFMGAVGAAVSMVVVQLVVTLALHATIEFKLKQFSLVS